MSKKFIGAVTTVVVFIIALIMLLICVEKIPTGYVGVVYSMNGGISDETLSQGWHIVSPTKHVKKFTVGNEQLILSKDKREGSPDDDSFSVSTADNANIKISFQMSYRFIPGQVVETFKDFKGMDGEDIVDQRVKTVLKSKISEVTTNYEMMDIYSGNRNKINTELTKFLNEELGEDYGIEVIDASIIDVHPDDQLEKAIKNRVTALQKKQQAQAEQETVKVEAETKLIKAKNEAEIKLTEAKAEAESNKLISSSITPELVDMKIAEARLQHGWITVTGSDTVVTDATDKGDK